MDIFHKSWATVAFFSYTSRAQWVEKRFVESGDLFAPRLASSNLRLISRLQRFHAARLGWKHDDFERPAGRICHVRCNCRRYKAGPGPPSPLLWRD